MFSKIVQPSLFSHSYSCKRFSRYVLIILKFFYYSNMEAILMQLEHTDYPDEKKRKTDRRILYTKKMIMGAYIQLLKEKPRDKIKVTEIARLAEINRCTFYLHFSDIKDIEIAIEEELINRIQKFADSQDYTSKDQVEQSYVYIEKLLQDDTFTTLLSSLQNESILFSVIQDYYKNFVSTSLAEDSPLSDTERKLLYSFIAGGILSTYQFWINNAPNNLEQENLFIDRLVKSVMSITHQKTKE